ncbi:ABC-type multidrug transport system, ATPase component [Halovivax ruber XH-70]|uniref:ABC-type multidrug transport system, ATPase component n=1 Tax=Halovivax ruber (strain DSM 18193 / JCM 13892 / XH-70) TaxID=797302 RepID=L0I5Q7_HALRX|nr:ABC transporter ATP-binding protein [Halovivax ruber]AGB14845.1 ABC-type multidrug transport system, ATPase component [Halovivax ruber XH-70]
MAAIELRGVTKRYGASGLRKSNDVTALRDVDLRVEDGEIFGFLGPNGAGKSTTIDIMLDYLEPTAGSVRVLGHDVPDESVRVREWTGVLPDGHGPVGERTGREHVEFAIEAKGADDDPDELLGRVGMLGPEEYPVAQYSKGMTQRLLLAMALVGEPDLLILDEPTTGLDPNGAREMREIIREENARGATVFFSSHILEQVEAVCDRVAILDRGEIVTVDSIENLRERAGGTATVTLALANHDEAAIERVRAVDGVVSVRVESAADDASPRQVTATAGHRSGGGDEQRTSSPQRAESAEPIDGAGLGDGAKGFDGDPDAAATVVVTCEARAKAAAIATMHECVPVTDVAVEETPLEDLFAVFTEGVA